MLTSAETVVERKHSPAVIIADVSVTAQGWADRIRHASGQAVEAIFTIGRQLIAARAALPHGQWERLFKGHPQAVERPVPFSVATAKMLMKIAEHPVLANSNHGNCLPPSWRTLYVLTFIPEAILEQLIRRGTISPELTRTQAETLIYACSRYKNAAEVAQNIIAYRKKRERREGDECLCQCSCGHIHPDQRVKRRLRELRELHEP